MRHRTNSNILNEQNKYNKLNEQNNYNKKYKWKNMTNRTQRKIGQIEQPRTN